MQNTVVYPLIYQFSIERLPFAYLLPYNLFSMAEICLDLNQNKLSSLHKNYRLPFSKIWICWMHLYYCNFQLGDAFTSRIATRVESRAQAEALLLVQLVVPGTINVYYGDEIGMTDLPDDRKVFFWFKISSTTWWNQSGPKAKRPNAVDCWGRVFELRCK